jgi:hypothetical protein
MNTPGPSTETPVAATPVPVLIPAAPTPVQLASIIMSSPKTAWVEFKDGIAFEICYVSKSKFKNITDKCTTLQFDVRQKVHQPRIDTAAMVEMFVREAVKNWRNVTPRKVAQIAPLDLSKVSAEQMDMEVPFSLEQLTALVKETYELDSFLQEAAMDIRCFNNSLVDKELSTKN